MSDQVTEEESLISQDDIDKLMESSSTDDSSSEDDLGELSQEDIDKMLNAPDEEDDDLELISQEDIDNLMNSNADDPRADEKEDKPEDIGGELSQEDIDSMLNADSGDEEDFSGDDDAEMISQDDINALLGSDSENQDTVAEEESGQDENIEGEETQETAAIKDNKEDGAPEKTKNKIKDDGYTIEESEALDVQECLVTQDTIDDLIKNFGGESEPAAEEQGSDDAGDDEEAVVLDEEPESRAEEETEAEEEESLTEASEPEDEEAGISQEDIDALLLDSDDDFEDEDEDDLLISQDDIDTLLMAADQEDEDVLGDLIDDDLPEDTDDEDILAEEGIDEGTGLDEEDQVVLEEGDEDDVFDIDDKPGKKIKLPSLPSGWYKSKLVIACASVLIVLGITVPAAYFLFLKDRPAENMQQETLASYDSKSPVQDGVNEVNINIKQQALPPVKESGNILLDNFVVLASDGSKKIGYITADISIDYADHRAHDEIVDNMPFYRGLIYDSIRKSFAEGMEEQVTEADILWSVEKSLKKMIPEHYISKVSFKSFKAS